MDRATNERYEQLRSDILHILEQAFILGYPQARAEMLHALERAFQPAPWPRARHGSERIIETLEQVEVPRTAEPQQDMQSIPLSQQFETTATTIRTTTSKSTSIATSTSTSTSTSTTGTGTQRLTGKICIRCFRHWERLLRSGEKITDCVFDGGPRKRKKCEYCSKQRSDCIPLPYNHVKRLLRQKRDMDNATERGYPIERRLFEDIYWEVMGEIKRSPIPEETTRLQRQREIKKSRRRREEAREESGEQEPGKSHSMEDEDTQTLRHHPTKWTS